MICPKCGAQMQDGSNMCIRCGTISYNNEISLDGEKNNSINQNIELNPNIEKPTFISNNIYADIHDDKLVKYQTILKIYINIFSVLWCIVAIINALKLNTSVFDVFVYGFIIIMHVITKKSIEKKTKPSGFISIILAVLMIFVTFDIPIFNIIFGILGILWIFCAIRYLIIIDKQKNKVIIIFSTVAVILISLTLLVLINLFFSINILNNLK